MNTVTVTGDLENINLEGQIEINNNLTKDKNLTSSKSMPDQANNGGGLGSSLFSSVPAFDVNALKPQEWISKRRKALKPWTEFMSFSKFKKPEGVGQAGSRLVKNIDHFQSNYLFVFIILAIYCVITSPYLLFAFMAFMGGCYIIHLKNKDGNLNIFGKELSLAQLYSAAAICSVPLFFLAGGTSAVFWIIGASLVIIVAHAVFYSRDEQEDPFTVQMNIV